MAVKCAQGGKAPEKGTGFPCQKSYNIIITGLKQIARKFAQAKQDFID
jgi:hypothetical protein